MQCSFLLEHEFCKTRTVVVFSPDPKLECLIEIYKTYKKGIFLTKIITRKIMYSEIRTLCKSAFVLEWTFYRSRENWIKY